MYIYIYIYVYVYVYIYIHIIIIIINIIGNNLAVKMSNTHGEAGAVLNKPNC